MSKEEKKKKVNGTKKGKQFERDVANALGHIFPEAERNLEYQASNCVGVDLNGTDIFRIQCKNYQAYASISKINEIRDEDPNHIPVLVTKGVRQKPMAVLPFEKFVLMLEHIYLGKHDIGDKKTIAAVEPAKIEPPRAIKEPASEIIMRRTPSFEDVCDNAECGEYDHSMAEGVKGEQTLPYQDVITKIEEYYDTEVEYMEGLEYNRMCLTFRDNGKQDENDYFLWLDWTKNSGFSRLIVEVAQLEKKMNASLLAVYVSDKYLEGSDEESTVEETTIEEAKVVTDAPSTSYSSLLGDISTPATQSQTSYSFI